MLLSLPPAQAGGYSPPILFLKKIAEICRFFKKGIDFYEIYAIMLLVPRV